MKQNGVILINRNILLTNKAENDSDALLKYLQENDIVDLSYMRNQMKMIERKEILKQHPNKIWQGTDGYWRTYIPEEGEERKLIKKKQKEKLEDVIIENYKLRRNNTFAWWFDSWKQNQISFAVSDNTVARYERDYRRFFKGTDFEKADIRAMNEEDITAFMVQTVKKKKLKEKAGDALWGYISGVYKHARIKRFIQENPCEYVEKNPIVDFTIGVKKVLNREQLMTMIWKSYYRNYITVKLKSHNIYLVMQWSLRYIRV